MSKTSEDEKWLKLRIEPIVQRAEQFAATIQRDLPGHQGIVHAATGVAAAAREAARVTKRLRRRLSLHRLPALFLAVALLLFATWCYWQFIRVSKLTIALPGRDAVDLQEHLAREAGVHFATRIVESSAEAVALVDGGQADVAFVQGGVTIPNDLPVLETTGTELVLFFLRDSTNGPAGVRRVLTSVAEAGSHTVAKNFFAAWGRDGQIEFLHDWTKLTNAVGADAATDYQLPADVDAVFVVKDCGDEDTLRAAHFLVGSGFRLASPDLGARELQFKYLRRHEVPVGYLHSDPPLPSSPTMTYAVQDYLVARRGLTPRLLALTGHLLDDSSDHIQAAGLEPDLATTSDMLQGVEAFLGILVYLGIAFLTLLGIEVMTYRRRFNELDSLISLISMHQSNKDVMGVTDATVRTGNLQYLSACSDLLGLISVIAGYYSQENASLLYNNLLGIIHDRSSSLKLNIQLKILHATIDVPTSAAVAVPAPQAVAATSPTSTAPGTGGDS